MKIKRYQSTEEKTILTALIVHDGVLGKIYQTVGKERQLFRSKWSNLVAGWCFKHYIKYHKAPRHLIQSYFAKYSQTETDPQVIDIVESFLSHLSDSYKVLAKEVNEQWTIDLASNYFDKIRLGRMADEVSAAIERGDLEEARAAKTKYQPIEFASSNDWVDPFSNQEIQSTLHFYEEDRSVVQFPGDLGRFLSPYFERDSFISLAAAEKKGKSFWLQEIVWQGVRQRRRVLYYVIGDMSKNQVQMRLYTRATGKPKKRRTIYFPKAIKPAGKDENGIPKADLTTEERKMEAFSATDIRKAKKKLQAMTASKQLRLKLYCAAASVLSASDIETHIRDLVRENWVPDLVVVDYADLLAPEAHSIRQEYRHQINETWKVLRRISLDYHCCLVTATQAAARAYDSWVIRKKDFSEDKRKNAHVTGMCGVNQTSEEKKIGIYRLNWVFLRDGEWTDTQVCWTAGSLALACPCIKSSLPSSVR